MDLKKKIVSIVGPIFNDIYDVLIWVSLFSAIIGLGICCLQLKNADSMERRDIIKRMRFIIIAFIAINLVSWFVMSYLKPKVEQGQQRIAIASVVNTPLTLSQR